MPETTKDKAEGAVQGKTTDVAVKANPSEGKQDAPYLHTWKNKEEADKGIKNLLELVSKTQSEKDKALAKLESMQEQVLSKLADATAPKPIRESSAERDARLKAIAAEWDDKGAPVMIQDIITFVDDSEKRLEQRFSELSKKERDTLQGEIDSLKGRLAEVDPEYVSQKDRVIQLAEELDLDVKKDRQILMRLAKRESERERPAREELPGESGTTRVVAEETRQEAPASLIANLKARHGNLSDKEIEALAKKFGKKKG